MSSPAVPSSRRRPRRPGGRRRAPRSRWVGAAAALLLVVGLTGCITSAAVSGGVLTIVGSDHDDTLALRLKSGDPTILEVDDGNDGSVQYSFDRATFTQIVVDGGAGNDKLTIDQSNGVFTDTEVTTLRGGTGADVLVGGSGGETLDGGPGDDSLEGNQGTDTVLGGDDADQVRWDPGDGSDVVDGGPGADHLAFNGSNVAELYDLSDQGGHVRLTRNVASIVMDIDGVEDLGLTLLGGADVAGVADLSATDLTSLTFDLAGFGGTDDGASDEIDVGAGTILGRDGTAATVTWPGTVARVVGGGSLDHVLVSGPSAGDTVQLRGTASAESVDVVADGTNVDVFGILPGLTTILSGVEQFAVDLNGGNDRFTATGNLAPLVAMLVIGGDGSDTIAGGNGNDTILAGAGSEVIEGNQGVDTIVAGEGDDLVRWDPGDGSDTVDGNEGNDQLTFNAANIGEHIDVTAVGGHVRVSRDVASVLLDLDGVEIAQVNLLGGNDTFTVGDLTGTDLVAVSADLASTPGSSVGDGLVDQVVVNGTAAPDAVQVVGFGAMVEVDGLPGTVQVTGADAGLDVLTVDGLAGADTFATTPLAAALIVLNLVD